MKARVEPTGTVIQSETGSALCYVDGHVICYSQSGKTWSATDFGSTEQAKKSYPDLAERIDEVKNLVEGAKS